MAPRRTPSLADEETPARLKLSPEVAWYMADRGIPLPDCPPRVKTPEPRLVPGARFDPTRVDRVLRSFGLLRHTQGKWARNGGLPLTPDPWQVAYILAPVFGWVRFDADAGDHVRIIRQLYVDVPRKNGKSTLSGGIAVFMACADGEPGAQVVTAATTERQAGFVFDPIKKLAASSAALKPFVKVVAKRVIHQPTGSYIEVISSAADAQHGANLHCGIVDELHIHPNGDMVETLETGTGSRTQPLIVLITTADSGKRNTVYDQRRTYIESLARGALADESYFGVIWAASQDDDPFAEATQRKANPGFGISPSRAFLVAEARKAQNSPADLAKYLRLHLGIRTKQETKFLELGPWDRNAGMVDELGLRGREAYGGLDLASTSDLCALCWLFPDETGGYDALWRLWTPQDNLQALDKRTAGSASVWAREGLLTVTSGNVVDYEFVEASIRADADRFDVRSVGYDRWNASALVNSLSNEGLTMVPVGQGFATMSAPLKEIQRMTLAGTAQRPLLRHGGNPAVRWMVDNLAVDMNPAGDVKPNKATSGDKIDAVSALVTALSEAMAREPEEQSVYETRGPLVINGL